MMGGRVRKVRVQEGSRYKDQVVVFWATRREEEVKRKVYA